MRNRTRAVVQTAPRQLELRELPLPEIDVTLDPHDGSLTLKTLCAIAHALGKRVTLTIE